MSDRDGKQAIERLQHVELIPAKTRKERGLQLKELEKMVGALGRGSNSLNQRATTLAALAAAALGAFGVFSSRIEEIDPLGLLIATAALVGVASLALVIAAAFALKAVRPAGKWTATFATRVESVAAGEMKVDLRRRQLLTTVKSQLERNYSKARAMKWSYRFTGVALVAATLAVLTALVAAVI